MSTKILILLIEDDRLDAELTQHLLISDDHHEFSFKLIESLKEAKSIISSEKFDATLLDLNLSDSNGIETFEALRNEPNLGAIVILTGFLDIETAKTALSYGATNYIVKGSMSSQQFKEAINFAIKQKEVIDYYEKQKQKTIESLKNLLRRNEK